ncbi:hypothetical protein [Paenibacillus alvei]|uniref:hypothetical protein n=1 Tax=Paenibacillus alvei TaxID=44250 RepID=UPI00227D9AD1|nr:hypothetical protein [Paenibacillus alvei]
MHQDETSIPIYKRWWFWIIGVELLAIIFFVGILTAQNNTFLPDTALEPEKEEIPPATTAAHSKEQKSQNNTADVSQKKTTPAEAQKEKQPNTKQSNAKQSNAKQSNAKQPNAKQPNAKQPNVKQPNVKQPVNIGYTPTEFQAAFNDFAEMYGSELRINDIGITPGDVEDLFFYMFTEKFSLAGTVNKPDGKIRDLTMTYYNGESSYDAGPDFLTSMYILIDLTNPDFAPDERKEVLQELGLYKGNKNIHKLDNISVRGDIRYQTFVSAKTGFVFAVGHASSPKWP